MTRDDGNPASAVRRTAIALATPYLNGRTVILTGPAAASATMRRFLSDGGARVVAVDLVDPPTETRARFTRLDRELDAPGPETVTRINAADPEGTALVYAGSFTSVPRLLGRRVLGSRAPNVLAMERKDAQQDLLPALGDVVPLPATLPSTTSPTVVQGVPTHGVAMATSHTYLVPPQAHGSSHTRQLLAQLAHDCTHLRLAPLDHGTPCTFYGFITTHGVVDFGPVRALLFWDPHSWRIHAPGIQRPLDLPPEEHRLARERVSAVARRLHDRTGYVGAFGTDGVITSGDYVIHEINPRVCAGFALLDRLCRPSAPLSAVDLVLRESPAEASKALFPDLRDLSATIRADPTPSVTLWDSPSPQPPRDAAGTGPDPAGKQTTDGAGRPGWIPLDQIDDVMRGGTR